MAVADFEPEPRTGKISSQDERLVLHCHRTPKVIRLVRDWAPVGVPGRLQASFAVHPKTS